MKQAVFISKEPHFWNSAQLIIDNIVVSLPEIKRVSTIKEANQFEQLILLADQLKWEDLLPQLNSDIELILPIFGNLTIEVERWLKLPKILEKRKVKIWVASRRQYQQACLFFNKELIYEIPFPLLEVFPLSPPSTNLLYSGRITQQKNILELLQVFEVLSLNFRKDLTLHLAGDFHKRGYHLHGIEAINYKEKCLEIIKRCSNIKYHGSLNQADLRKIISICNTSISLSTYHDEDYGYSLAQSLLAGHRIIISDWGGHANYFNFKEVSIIPIKVYNNIPFPDKELLLKKLISLQPIANKTNQEIQMQAKDYFSAYRFKKSFDELLLNEPILFGVISPLFKAYLGKAIKFFPFHPDVAPDLYSKIYQSYLK